MLLGWGGDAVYAQAESMVRKGLVLKADIKGDLISGVIARESSSEIYTKLRLRSNGTIESLCPCSTHRNLGLVCPHVVALGIALMLRHSDPLREQKYNEEQRRARRLAEVDAASYIQRSARGVPARVQVLLPQTWTADFWQGAVALHLQLVAEDRLLSPETLPKQLCFAFSPEEDALLAVLEDICEGPPPERCTLTAADLLNV
ncbi:MAG: hypothetical protein GX748_14945, partial [Lentisphaerae bacterium]|nr:hypothetical protein [Lentisphaerota bacterium]